VLQVYLRHCLRPTPYECTCIRVRDSGQRARYIAVGTATGSLYVWDVRARASRNSEVVTQFLSSSDQHGISSGVLPSCDLTVPCTRRDDGLVQAWDPWRPLLDLFGLYIHGLVSRSSPSFQAEASYSRESVITTSLQVLFACIQTLRFERQSFRGTLFDTGRTVLRCDEYKSKQASSRRSHRGSNGSAEDNALVIPAAGFDGLHCRRATGKYRDRRLRPEEREHLNHRFGLTCLDLRLRAELLAYAQMLAKKTYTVVSTIAGNARAALLVVVRLAIPLLRKTAHFRLVNSRHRPLHA